MIDGLVPLAVADCMHQAGDPLAGVGLPERNAASPQESEYELEVLQLLNRDRIQLIHMRIEITVFLEIDGRCCRFPFQMRVIHQHLGEVAKHFGQPLGRNAFAE